MLRNELHTTIDGRLCHLWKPESVLIPGFVTYDGDEEELEDIRKSHRLGLVYYDEKNHAVGTTLLGLWFSTLQGLN